MLLVTLEKIEKSVLPWLAFFQTELVFESNEGGETASGGLNYDLFKIGLFLRFG